MNYRPKKILYFGLIIHCAMSGWFYTSPGIFYDNDDIKWYDIKAIFT